MDIFRVSFGDCPLLRYFPYRAYGGDRWYGHALSLSPYLQIQITHNSNTLTSIMTHWQSRNTDSWNRLTDAETWTDMCGCAVLPTNFRSSRLSQFPTQSSHQLKREQMRSCRSKQSYSTFIHRYLHLASGTYQCQTWAGAILGTFWFIIPDHQIPDSLESLGSEPGPDYSTKIDIWSTLFWLSGHLCQVFSRKQICFIASEELLLSPGVVGFRKLWLKFLLYLKILAFGFPEK